MESMKWVFVFFNLLVLITISHCSDANETDYCHVKNCNNPQFHVYCLHPNDKFSEACYPNSWTVQVKQLTEQDKNNLIIAHEWTRSNKAHCSFVPNFNWDEDLEKLAQRWAKQCPNNDVKDKCRSLDKFSGVVYQNVYTENDRGLFFLNQTIDLSNIIQIGSDQSKTFEQIVQQWNQRYKNHPAFNGAGCEKLVNRIGCAVVIRRHASSEEVFDKISKIQNLHRYELKTAKHIVCNYGTYYPNY